MLTRYSFHNASTCMNECRGYTGKLIKDNSPPWLGCARIWTHAHRFEAVLRSLVRSKNCIGMRVFTSEVSRHHSPWFISDLRLHSIDPSSCCCLPCEESTCTRIPARDRLRLHVASTLADQKASGREFAMEETKLQMVLSSAWPSSGIATYSPTCVTRAFRLFTTAFLEY